MIKIIPSPTSFEIIENKSLNLNGISLGDNIMSDDVIQDFFDFVSKCGINKSEDTNVIFKFDNTLESEEYILEINDKIYIAFATVSGQIYALQTLKQILFQCKNNIPNLIITDKPTYKIRGFMLDSGRYFFPVNDVKCMIRRMALHKLNFFHFHITEDQGWRIQIDKYPLLTEKGSIRKKTNYGFKKQKGFYTKDDIKEIVAYAHNFGIKVMPEFDIPGHSRAAIACYPYLSCFNRNLPVADHWGVKHDVLCAGKNSTYEFVKDVIDEFCELFPDEYFHIGGDEVPKHRWKLCPNCQQKMQELGIKDEDDLQCYFMNEMKNYCKEKGKQAFMWSWDLKDDTIIDYDLGFTKCGDTDTHTRPFIDTGNRSYYIDLPYGYISLKKCADHKPFSGNCLGVEAPLWTEYVPNMKKADKMTYPRLFAVCETAWNGETSHDKIMDGLDYYYNYLDINNIGYSKIKTANPSKIRAKLQILWFERRQLTWEGLGNLIDDKKVEKIAKNNKNKNV